MGAHSTMQSSLGQERDGACDEIRRPGPKSVWRDTPVSTFWYRLCCC